MVAVDVIIMVFELPKYSLFAEHEYAYLKQTCAITCDNGVDGLPINVTQQMRCV